MQEMQAWCYRGITIDSDKVCRHHAKFVNPDKQSCQNTAISHMLVCFAWPPPVQGLGFIHLLCILVFISCFCLCQTNNRIKIGKYTLHPSLLGSLITLCFMCDVIDAFSFAFIQEWAANNETRAQIEDTVLYGYYSKCILFIVVYFGECTIPFCFCF